MAQSMAMETFVNNLEKVLAASGMMWKDLAEKAGIFPQAMSRVRSMSNALRLDTASDIADAAGYPLHELLNPDFQPLPAKRTGKKTTAA